ncbi:MAG: amidase [Candidatus Cloacimonetes bacterium]|jgi:Asp-tRNA(Asn)/Glu-tRNA(Gln) amidotransferase A subunit family amidase|nr:amidase [Candidatus Cloacimonadota bacterium]MBT5420792.1 amidase [Candidatus Cloacimonadota bacterium]
MVLSKVKFVSECSLSKVISHLQNKELTPEKLIDDLCDKLEKWDKRIKAFLSETNRRERLHQELKELYHNFPYPNKRPILFGIPIGVKDIFHVNGFETKAGSDLPSEILQGEESVAVSKLKQAGALIMGKTVTTEFAYFHPGATCNPHNFAHTPGGSSSGSAAAVAAGFCPLALGTQTIGSISRPASFCGVIGFKPSIGRISTAGVIPFSKSADHIGFFTQDLKGSEIVASILCDNWDNDLPELNRKPILGIPEGKYLQQASPEILSTFWKVVDNLKQKGYIIKSITTFNNIDEINDKHKLMSAAEFAEVHKDWFNKYGNKYHQASIDLIKRGRDIPLEILDNAIKGRTQLREELEQLQKENGIDLWLSPSSVTTAPHGLDSTGDPAMNLPWTYAGVPTLSIPFGLYNELPFGIQFAGNYNKDESLFKLVKDVL